MSGLAIPIISTIGNLIDKIIPDPKLAAEAKIQIATLEQNGEFRELEIAMNAIVMEAKSNDPWTSRARPAFLYVVYIFILSAIPMGVISAIDPVIAKDIATGVKEWLTAIPTEMWALFGVGYTGYVKKRSDDKAVLLGKEPKKLLGIF